MAFAKGGAGDQDIEFPGDVADFPVPRAVVLDLPEEGFTGLRVFQRTHRQVAERGPGSLVGNRNAVERKMGEIINRGINLREPEVLEASRAPLAFASPGVVGEVQLHLLIPDPLATERCSGECGRGNILEQHGLLAGVHHIGP